MQSGSKPEVGCSYNISIKVLTGDGVKILKWGADGPKPADRICGSGILRDDAQQTRRTLFKDDPKRWCLLEKLAEACEKFQLESKGNEC